MVLILNWFTFETLLRLQNWGFWIAIGGAVIATLAGGFTYFVSQQTAARRESIYQEDLFATLTQSNQWENVSASKVKEVEQLLDQSEKRSALFLSKIEAMERELSVLRAERDQGPETSTRDLDPEELSRALSPISEGSAIGMPARQKFLRALQDKPTGEITLVTVSGKRQSRQLAEELRELLEVAGWSVRVRSENFSEIPRYFYLVVQDLEKIPEPAKSLSLGLSLIDLMEMPAKVKIDPSRPSNSLEMVIGVS